MAKEGPSGLLIHVQQDLDEIITLSVKKTPGLWDLACVADGFVGPHSPDDFAACFCRLFSRTHCSLARSPTKSLVTQARRVELFC